MTDLIMVQKNLKEWIHFGSDRFPEWETILKLSLMKVLSKSRFKLGLECPNKIYFSNNTKVFNNIKKEDPFLDC